MKNQCFGGEYLGEVYDHMLKRSAFRRQKRWWNAYILFYERIDDPVADLSTELQKVAVGESTTKVVRFLFQWLVWLLWLLLYAHRHQSILGTAGHIILTPANQLMVIGLKNMVTVQSEFRTRDHSISGSTHLPTGPKDQ
jgi:hypothetical protein